MSLIFINGGFVNIQKNNNDNNNNNNNDNNNDKKIHEHIYEKNLNNLYDCCICCEEYQKEDMIFPCVISKNHHTCKKCFEDWKINCCKTSKEITCPICRNVIPKNGRFTYYYENNIKREEIDYVDNIPNGLVQLWSPEGILQKKFYTQNYKYNGIYEEYDELGFLKKRIFYENGVYNGLFEEYYPNEILKVRCQYVNGAIKGLYQLFYNTSLLFLECQCGPFAGKINGKLEIWNEEGELIERYNCKNANINIMFDKDMNVSYSKKTGIFEPLPIDNQE